MIMTNNQKAAVIPEINAIALIRSPLIKKNTNPTCNLA